MIIKVVFLFQSFLILIVHLIKSHHHRIPFLDFNISIDLEKSSLEVLKKGDLSILNLFFPGCGKIYRLDTLYN